MTNPILYIALHRQSVRCSIINRHIANTGHFLAMTLLIALGFNTYGCGDTASVNPPATLASMTVTPGTLQPAFNSGTTQYTVNLSNDVTSVTITAQPAVGSDTVTINNQATKSSVITLGAAGTTTSVTVTVSGSGTSPQTYAVNLVRASFSNSLQDLTVSPGTPPIAFNADTLNYTVDVDGTVESVDVTPTLQDPAATMTVLVDNRNAQPATSGKARSITLNAAGGSTLITIEVTAQNDTKKSYTILVNRGGLSSVNTLQSLTVSLGTGTTNLISFSPTIFSYPVNVASAVKSVMVTPTLPPNSNASMTLSVNNGQPSNINSGEDRPITLGQPNSNTFINIIVTAQNGNRNTYVVAVDRAPSNDNDLSALTVRVDNAVQTLSPSFARNTTAYRVNVASNVTSVTVSATKSDPNAAMVIGSVTVPAGTATGQASVALGGQGSETPVSITVTPQIGTPQTYSITVTRLSSNNNLSALSVTAGTAVLPLSPPFGSNTVNVATDITSVTVTATLEDTNATMEINGQGTSSGVPSAPITLGPPGATDIPIVVIAPNGNRKDYKITVIRAASNNNNLVALSVTAEGTAQPLDVTADPPRYRVNVASTVTSVLVTATKSDPNSVLSGSVADPGAGVATGQATILLGGVLTTTPVAITVTAPDGTTKKTYTIDVFRTFLVF